MSKRIILWLLRFYKKRISPLGVGKHCRFTPTCSMYMYEAVERYGSIKGVKMGLKRLARCHPYGDSGYDPVP